MKRVQTLLKKLEELAEIENKTALDIDLMLDYTRVLYADLLETKSRINFNNNIQVQNIPESPKTHNKVEEQPFEPDKTEPITLYVSTSVKDIRSHIGINDKYLFIEELFANNKPEYDNAVKTLNSFDNIVDAKKWIDLELSSKYKWNKDSETTIAFYDTVKSFFSDI